MDTGLYVAATGGLQKVDWLDAHSNNMANIKEELEAEDTTVLQNNLEMSNVSIVEEMVSMITVLRSYETHMKLIKEFDEITDKAVSLNREAAA